MTFHLHLDTESVDRIYAAQPVCVSSEMSVRDVMRQMQQQNRGAVLICEQERLVGIFTERDALRVMAQGGDFDQPIAERMVKAPVTLTPSQTVGEAITVMSSGGYRRLPIVDDQQRPIGIMKVSGILNYLVTHFPSVIYNLPPQPHHATQEREGA